MTAHYQLRDDDGHILDLELFKFDSCPFCIRVMSVVRDLDVQVRLRDTRREDGARDELIKRGGKSQVPCLFIDGQALYESTDIIAFLQSRQRVSDALPS